MHAGKPCVGDIYEKHIEFHADAIRGFAAASGDTNPLHHDENVAAASRFGGLIASGPHFTALMMGVVADSMARSGESVGLEFAFKFRKAVPAGSRMKVTWTVTGLEPSPKLGGDLAHLDGILAHDGVAHVEATGTVLCMWDRPRLEAS